MSLLGWFKWNSTLENHALNLSRRRSWGWWVGKCKSNAIERWRYTMLLTLFLEVKSKEQWEFGLAPKKPRKSETAKTVGAWVGSLQINHAECYVMRWILSVYRIMIHVYGKWFEFRIRGNSHSLPEKTKKQPKGCKNILSITQSSL